jgi:hypothetical protein
MTKDRNMTESDHAGLPVATVARPSSGLFLELGRQRRKEISRLKAGTGALTRQLHAAVTRWRGQLDVDAATEVVPVVLLYRRDEPGSIEITGPEATRSEPGWLSTTIASPIVIDLGEVLDLHLKELLSGSGTLAEEVEEVMRLVRQRVAQRDGAILIPIVAVYTKSAGHSDTHEEVVAAFRPSGQRSGARRKVARRLRS